MSDLSDWIRVEVPTGGKSEEELPEILYLLVDEQVSLFDGLCGKPIEQQMKGNEGHEYNYCTKNGLFFSDETKKMERVYVYDPTYKSNEITKRFYFRFVVHMDRFENIEHILSHLWEGAVKSSFGEFKETLLHYAVWLGQTSIVRSLIELGAIKDASNAKGTTPLLVAIYKGNIEMVKTLIGIGADVDVRSDASSTPLHYVAISGHNNIAELLIKNTADVDARDDKRSTPLHYAAFRGHNNIAEMLIEKKADLEARDDKRSTPLHYAAFRGHNNIAEMLIEKKADLEAKDISGNNVLHWAAHRGNIEMIKYILGLKPKLKSQKNVGGQTPYDVVENEHILFNDREGDEQTEKNPYLETMTSEMIQELTDLLNPPLKPPQ